MNTSAPQHTRSRKGHGVYCTELYLGVWKNRFSENDLKVILATGLNWLEKEHKRKLQLLGYLITSSRLSLIVEIEWGTMEKVLQELNLYIMEEIRHSWREDPNVDALDTLPEMSQELLSGKLFKPHPLYNNDLMLLLTGREPNYQHHNPYLEKIKDELRGYEYSSALDYTGAISTVTVTLKEPDFWEDQLERTKEKSTKWVAYRIIKKRS